MRWHYLLHLLLPTRHPQVLQAANYLQMDWAQETAAEYLKGLVSKTDFITVYNFALSRYCTVLYLDCLVSKTGIITVFYCALSRGIHGLVSFITSTILKPEEVGLLLSSPVLLPSVLK